MRVFSSFSGKVGAEKKRLAQVSIAITSLASLSGRFNDFLF
jgi:hypothetical protein